MSFRELSELVSSGKLRLIHIEGVRRTISTALEIALTEAADGQINEPFDRGDNNFEGACEEIAKRAAMLGANERGGNNPLLLLVKNTCPMSADDWQRYIGVVDNFVTITRDPQQQLHSMMEQKGKVVGRSLRVEFSPQDYQAYESILFFQTFTDEWQRFSERHTLLQEHLATNPDKRHVIVDGGLLKVQPEHTLREITQQLQLPADEATIQAMAFNRTKAAGQKFYDTAIDQLKASGLVDDALSGRAFTPQASHDLPFRVFGERAQSHLVDVAIPIHTGLLRDAKMLRPKTVAEVSALSQMPVGNGKTFGEENSPLCYTLAATAEDEGRPEEKHRLLSAVRKQHAVDNGQAFDAINQLTGVYVIQYVEKKMGFGHTPDNLNYWKPYNSHQIYHADKEKPLVFYFGGIPIMSRQQAPEKSICDEVLSYLKDFKKDDYQLLIVSERPTTNKHELGEKYNNDPQQFYTSNAAEFVQSMLLPLIKESQTLNDLKSQFSRVTLTGHSYGTAFIQSVSNALRTALEENSQLAQHEIREAMQCIRALNIGPICTVVSKPADFTQLFTVSTQDKTSNEYIDHSALVKHKHSVLSHGIIDSNLLLVSQSMGKHVLAIAAREDTGVVDATTVENDAHSLRLYMNVNHDPHPNLRVFQVNASAELARRFLNDSVQGSITAVAQRKPRDNPIGFIKESEQEWLTPEGKDAMGKKIAENRQIMAGFLMASGLNDIHLTAAQRQRAEKT